jgi:hypothetical protein
VSAGKGSVPRPCAVSPATYTANWDRTFGAPSDAAPEAAPTLRERMRRRVLQRMDALAHDAPPEAA